MRVLNRRATATEEMEQQGNYSQYQQNVDKSAGYVESSEAQKPQHQKNPSNDR
jgi:hypothetical protein